MRGWVRWVRKVNGHRGCPRWSSRPILWHHWKNGNPYRAGLNALEARLLVSHPDLDWLDGMRAFKAEADAVIRASPGGVVTADRRRRPVAAGEYLGLLAQA